MSPRPKPRASSPPRALPEIVARALVARDPVAQINAARRDKRLPLAVRRALVAASDDGIRMTALLIAKLRFERLLQGSLEAAAWFDEDPRSFSAAFRRYHEEVPPTASFPPQEAILFATWLSEGRGHAGSI